MAEPGEPRVAGSSAHVTTQGEASETRLADLGSFIRDQRRNARLSLRKLSERAGISNPYLSQIERGLRKPSAEILQAIAKGLRISSETLYVRAGILEEREEGPGLVEDILRDTTITERQKQALVEIYRSFQAEAAAERGAAGREIGPKPSGDASSGGKVSPRDDVA